MIHTEITVRLVAGRYVIDWTQGKPLAGDQVLMSAELFEKSIDALNGSGPWASTREAPAPSGRPAHRVQPVPTRSLPLADATPGRCRASSPCPACVHAMHGKPPTSQSGVSASKDGSR